MGQALRKKLAASQRKETAKAAVALDAADLAELKGAAMALQLSQERFGRLKAELQIAAQNGQAAQQQCAQLEQAIRTKYHLTDADEILVATGEIKRGAAAQPAPAPQEKP